MFLNSKLIKINLVALALSSLAACGGGGGDENTPTKTGFYNGLTNQAVISADNFSNFNLASVQKGIIITKADIDAMLTNPNNNSVSGLSNSVVNPVQNPKEEKCQFTGSKLIKVEHVTESSEASLSAKFNTCSDIVGETQDGALSVYALNDTVTPENNKVRISFDNFSFKSPTDHTVANGSLSYTGSIVNTIKMDIVVEDKTRAETTKVEDFVIVTTQQTNQESTTVFGKIYQSKLGYVEMETTKAIVTKTNDLNPSSGELLIKGVSKTSGLKAFIIINYIDVDNYQIRVDFDSEGNANDIYEFNKVCSYSDPTCLTI